MRSFRAKVNGSVLAWARDSAGYDLDTAANRIKVKPSALQAWERDEGAPTLAQLRKLAEAYKRPLAVLYLEKPPRDFQAKSLQDFRRPAVAGESQKLSTNLTLEIRTASQRRVLAVELFDELEHAVPQFGFRCTVDEDPEVVGLALREHLGMEGPPSQEWYSDNTGRIAFNSWRRAIESRAALVFQMTRVSSDEASGFTLADDVLPVLAVNRKDHPKRRTFSLLHECAHAALHQAGISQFDDVAPSANVEVFCNRVAASTLMPRPLLLEHPEVARAPSNYVNWQHESIFRIARTFGVSADAMLYRLSTIGKTTTAFYLSARQEYERMFIEMERRAKSNKPGKKKDFKRNPVTEAIGSLGRPFIGLVLQGYAQDALTLSEASSYLGVRTKHIPTLQEKVGA